MSDVVQIRPSDFDKSSAHAIEDFINAKYADKVVHKLGLCVGFHSIISTSEGLIGHGTGIVNVNVDFRMIVFRPFKGEILNATITQSAPALGIVLSHDFFEDVVVPPETLFDDTEWGKDDMGTEAFIWYQKVDEEDEPNQFFFDRAERCLYRVEEEQWHDMSPNTQRSNQDFDSEDAMDGREVRKTPYLIRGSMMLSGLGPTLWWLGEGQEDDPMEIESGEDSD